MFRISLLPTCLLLLAGCAAVPTYQTYPGSALPLDEVASVKTESERNHSLLAGLDNRLYIVAVDGVRPPSKSTTDVPYPESAVLLPGSHNITVLYEHFGKWAIVKVGGNFVAGKSYIVRQQPDSKLLKVWIEELATKEHIGDSSANMDAQG